MTVTQAERLVRKIAEVVSQPASDTQTAKLAQDYAELCRAANRRLEQCAIMIEAGQFLQALQLAETPPPLLDLITLLGFRQAAEWRAYCQAHQLPWTEPFYDKYIRLLNTAYGKGIASDHPFYRDYRRAVMENDDARALSILRVIARLNPSDAEHQGGIETAGGEIIAGQTGKLAPGCGHGRQRRDIRPALEQLEASGLPVPASHPVWQQAQVARCQQMLRRAEELRQQDVWQDVGSRGRGNPRPGHALQRSSARGRRRSLDGSGGMDDATARRLTRRSRIFKRAFSALEYEVRFHRCRNARPTPR